MRIYFALIAGALVTQIPTTIAAQDDKRWSTAVSLSQELPAVRNSLRVTKSQLIWNGRPISEDGLKIMLEAMSTQIDPQPLLVLSHDSSASGDRVAAIKKIVNGQLNCNPDVCLELTPGAN